MENRYHNKIHMLSVGLFFSLILSLSACLPVTPIAPLPKSSSTPTNTTTPTILWFPPTPTRTLVPTIVASATTEFRPGIGLILFEDKFTNVDHWLTGDMGKGTIALGENELSLVLTQPKGYLFSYRDEPTLDNFYAEIVASPSLCAGLDEYGLLVRYDSPVDFYRFSLSCDGQTRLDKLVNGAASSPQPWLISASVPSAAPSQSRIGVWASGSEMRFFINDEFQFSINDRMLTQGMIGVFVRSGGENAVTVSYSDLEVYQIQP